MRARRQPPSAQKGQGDIQSFREPKLPALVTRIFNPAELDLDDLAEAIRSLIGSSSVPQINSSGGTESSLLSFPRRATHVLEANETP